MIRQITHLLCILALACAFRFIGLNWDQGVHNHPDERHLSLVMQKISLPQSFSLYFDTDNSTLNPLNVGFNSYVYGTLPLFLVKTASVVTGNDTYKKSHLVGRFLSAFFDTLSTLFIYLVGMALYSRRHGLLAAALYACAVLSIQYSHFFVVDSFVVFFGLLTFYFSLKIYKGGGPFFFVCAGIAAGLTLACKVSALPFVLIPALAASFSSFPVKDRKLSYYLKPAALALSSVLITFLVFRIFQPYAFKPFSLLLEPRFLNDLSRIRELSSNPSLFPPSLQWINRPWFYPFENMLLWGFGPVLGLAVFGGFIFTGYQIIFKKDLTSVLPFSIASLVLALHSTQFVTVMRYFLPAYPYLIIMSSVFLLSLPKLASKVAIICVLIFTFLWAIAFTEIYRAPFVRIEASKWIEKYVPPDSYTLVEHWDDSLPVQQFRNTGKYIPRQLKVFEADSPLKREHLVSQLEATDYVYINSKRGYGAIPRNTVLYPITSLYYELLFREELGFKLVATFNSPPRILGIEFPTDFADESFSVYDHPRIFVFKKDVPLTRSEIIEKLSASPSKRPRLSGDEMIALAKSLAESRK